VREEKIFFPQQETPPGISMLYTYQHGITSPYSIPHKFIKTKWLP